MTNRFGARFTVNVGVPNDTAPGVSPIISGSACSRVVGHWLNLLCPRALFPQTAMGEGVLTPRREEGTCWLTRLVAPAVASDRTEPTS